MARGVLRELRISGTVEAGVEVRVFAACAPSKYAVTACHHLTRNYGMVSEGAVENG
jgi:hypothetical protein